MTGSARVAALVLSAVAGSSCTGDDTVPLPGVVWEGESLHFASEYELDEFCAGTLPYMDRYVASLRHELSDDDRAPVKFYHVDDALERYRPGCQEHGGCAWHLHVLADAVPFEHELVHAVLPGPAPAHPLIEEGAAVMWGNDLGSRLRPER